MSGALALERASMASAGEQGTKRQRQLRADLAKAKARAGAGFRLQDGMAEQTGTVPMKSVFDLTAAVDVPLVTALRIEVPPGNPAKARHSPERGLCRQPAGCLAGSGTASSDPIAFRLVAPDSIADVEGNIRRMLRNAPPSASPAEVMPRLAAN